jgi:hypothetical protein
MFSKSLKIAVSIVLVLVLSSGGVCALLSQHKVNPSCQKAKNPDNDIMATISGLCKIQACSLNKTHLFILPDISLLRFETEYRSVLTNPVLGAISIVTDIPPENRIKKGVLKIPLSFRHPQIYYLNCALIC